MSIPARNGKTILITEINGYNDKVLGLNLLTKGNSIRASRHAASAGSLFKGLYTAITDRVQIYKVPNMTIDGAFDEAADSVEGVMHTASPINLSLTGYSRFITPAIRESQVILDSALLAGLQLSSMVITSSAAAVFDAEKPALYVFTEADLATSALETADKDKADGVKTPLGMHYLLVKLQQRRQSGDRGTNIKQIYPIHQDSPEIWQEIFYMT